jgi:hypothetical protein
LNDPAFLEKYTANIAELLKTGAGDKDKGWLHIDDNTSIFQILQRGRRPGPFSYKDLSRDKVSGAVCLPLCREWSVFGRILQADRSAME